MLTCRHTTRACCARRQPVDVVYQVDPFPGRSPESVTMISSLTVPTHWSETHPLHPLDPLAGRKTFSGGIHRRGQRHSSMHGLISTCARQFRSEDRPRHNQDGCPRLTAPSSTKKPRTTRFKLGVVFRYERCPELRQPDAIDLIASAWLACKPLVDLAR
jgi:hypothetical protein